MEGAIFLNRPALPLQSKPTQSSQQQRLKSNPSTPILPPQLPSPPSFTFDTLLNHLIDLSTTPPSATTHKRSKTIQSSERSNTQFTSFKNASRLRRTSFKKTNSSSLVTLEESEVQLDDGGGGSLHFLSQECKFMVDSILEQPVCNLPAFFDSVKFKLIEVDWVSLLKGLTLLGDWDRALCLFEWLLENKKTSRSFNLDKEGIEFMVKMLGRESQNSILSNLFDDFDVVDYMLDVRALTTILHSHSHSGKYNKAIALFEKMKEKGISLNVVAYNVMLDVYGKMGRSWDKILSLLGEMRSKELKFDEFTCSTVISACGREGLLDEAKAFYAGIKAHGYQPGTVTYNSLLQVFGKAGMYLEALNILKEMEESNCPPDSFTYNGLMLTYVRAGFFEEGTAVIDTMTQKGVMPDAVTYTTIIDAYGKAGQEDKALSLFKLMKQSGCAPKVYTYNTILGMLGKKSRSEEMMEILHDMKANSCSPNHITWNTMLAVCGNKAMHPYLKRVLREMKSCGFKPDRDTFNTLISAYGRCGLAFDAVEVHTEMIEMGFNPCVTTYNALLNALARLGNWKAAELVFSDMKGKGFRPSETSYSFMLHCYSKGKNLRGLDSLAKEIYDGRIFPSWMLLRSLILANFNCGSLGGMEKAFQELQKHGYKLDLIILNSMLSMYSRHKLCDEVRYILHLIDKNGLQPDLFTFNALMDMHARMGDCWEAEEILRKIQKSGGKPDLVSYNTVIKGFCRQGHMDEAKRVLSEMTNEGFRPCILTYNTLVAGFAAQGLFSEMNDVICYMIKHNCRPNMLTYKTVVDGYCRAKKYYEALEFVTNIRKTDSSFPPHYVQNLAALARGNSTS